MIETFKELESHNKKITQTLKEMTNKTINIKISVVNKEWNSMSVLADEYMTHIKTMKLLNEECLVLQEKLKIQLSLDK